MQCWQISAGWAFCYRAIDGETMARCQLKSPSLYVLSSRCSACLPYIMSEQECLAGEAGAGEDQGDQGCG